MTPTHRAKAHASQQRLRDRMDSLSPDDAAKLRAIIREMYAQQ